MKILIFLIISFSTLFGSVSNIVSDFESMYSMKPKQEMDSSPFNNDVGMQEKMKPEKQMMNGMLPSVNNDIQNQQYVNNQEDISMSINHAIEEYMSSIFPLIAVVLLFGFLGFLIYAIVSSMSTSSLKKKIDISEKYLLNRINELGSNDSNDIDGLLGDLKKVNLRLTSLETMVHKIKKDNKKNNQISEPVAEKEIPKQIIQEEKDDDDFFLDDNFAIDDDFDINDDSDEKISLDDSRIIKKEKKEKTPLTDLSSLNMDIKAPLPKKENKLNTQEMEEFSLDDFND